MPDSDSPPDADAGDAARPSLHPQVEETATAIASMETRGAANIADAAAAALGVQAEASTAETPDVFRAEL
jgi:ribose 1,5-bisphosphate isomerase